MPFDIARFTYDSQLHNAFEGLCDSARVWIWQSPRPLSSEECKYVSSAMGSFIEQWTSHNQALKAISKVVFDRFLVVGLDQERSHQASGCSIDSLTHAVEKMAIEIDVDLFDRSTCYIYLPEQIVSIQLSELSQAVSDNRIAPTSLIFNPLVNTNGDLLNRFLIPISESWHSRFI